MHPLPRLGACRFPHMECTLKYPYPKDIMAADTLLAQEQAHRQYRICQNSICHLKSKSCKKCHGKQRTGLNTMRGTWYLTVCLLAGCGAACLSAGCLAVGCFTVCLSAGCPAACLSAGCLAACCSAGNLAGCLSLRTLAACLSLGCLAPCLSAECLAT